MILKILSYNIRFGGAEREQYLISVIRDSGADLVIFQEAIIPRVIEKISEALGMTQWMAKKNHSVGYCSRIPIDHHEWHYPRGSRHPYLEVVLAGGHARIFGVHLRAMFSNWGEKRRKLEIQSLLTSIKKHQEGFHVLVGDFNSLAPNELLDVKKMPGWIRAMIWLSGRNIQREVVQVMLDNGYVDGFRALHPDIKGYTFPTYDPHLRFDYIFVPLLFPSALKECQVFDKGADVPASDHFPLLAHLEFEV